MDSSVTNQSKYAEPLSEVKHTVKPSSRPQKSSEGRLGRVGAPTRQTECSRAANHTSAGGAHAVDPPPLICAHIFTLQPRMKAVREKDDDSMMCTMQLCSSPVRYSSFVSSRAISFPQRSFRSLVAHLTTLASANGARGVTGRYDGALAKEFSCIAAHSDVRYTF